MSKAAAIPLDKYYAFKINDYERNAEKEIDEIKIKNAVCSEMFRNPNPDELQEAYDRGWCEAINRQKETSRNRLYRLRIVRRKAIRRYIEKFEVDFQAEFTKRLQSIETQIIGILSDFFLSESEILIRNLIHKTFRDTLNHIKVKFIHIYLPRRLNKSLSKIIEEIFEEAKVDESPDSNIHVRFDDTQIELDLHRFHAFMLEMATNREKIGGGSGENNNKTPTKP